MDFKKDSIEDFSAALAGKTSVPGGGGASALVGALGIALGSMVGEYTVGKKKYAAVEEDIKKLMAEAELLRNRLLNCINEDARLFEPLSKAYGIPKDEPGRDEVLEKCLRDAAEVPMEILRLSCKALELIEEFAEKGSTLMISDAATGAAICKAALLGAAANVKVNTKLMKDRAYADALNEETDLKVIRYGSLADAVYESVCSTLV